MATEFFVVCNEDALAEINRKRSPEREVQLIRLGPFDSAEEAELRRANLDGETGFFALDCGPHEVEVRFCSHEHLHVSDRNLFVCDDCGEEIGR